MSEEWLDQLIVDAQKTFKKPVISHNTDSLQGDTLEEKCSILLQGFSNSAEIRYLEGVYRLTQPLFSWFARKRSCDYGLKLEESRITDRLYGLLSEAALRPDTQVPTEYLFKWCFALIENIVDLERRQLAKSHHDGEDSTLDALYPTNSEVWSRDIQTNDQDHVEEKLIKVMLTGDAKLSPIEKDVLTRYYEDMELKSIALKLNIEENQARKHLVNGRLKVLRVLYRDDQSRFWQVAEEEKQP